MQGFIVKYTNGKLEHGYGFSYFLDIEEANKFFYSLKGFWKETAIINIELFKCQNRFCDKLTEEENSLCMKCEELQYDAQVESMEKGL